MRVKKLLSVSEDDRRTEWSVESYVLALSLRSAVDVVGGGERIQYDDCC